VDFGFPNRKFVVKGGMSPLNAVVCLKNFFGWEKLKKVANPAF